ncbi:autotransporter [Variovorax beijingensis]|nr:autotransporter [Variovorax beijingensis]
MMMTSHPLVSSTLQTAIDEIVDAAAKADRLDRVAAVLRDITARFHALGELIHEASDDEVLLCANDTLTIYHITLTPGLQYPPHNHLMDALIGIYRGKETNFIYPLSEGRLQVPEQREAIAPEVVHLPPDTVHAVANPGTARSGALHVYLGNLLRTKRQMWRFAGDWPDVFDNHRYLAEARAIES